jgi:hypothetical protein
MKESVPGVKLKELSIHKRQPSAQTGVPALLKSST